MNKKAVRQPSISPLHRGKIITTLIVALLAFLAVATYDVYHMSVIADIFL